jgi:hypothetical protein
MRILTAVIAFVVGFAIAWLILPAPKPQVQPIGDPLVRVHQDGKVSRPEIRIDRTNTVGWAADEGGDLQILFPKSRFPEGVTEPPFEGMTLTGNDWAVRCGSGFCFSGKVNEKLPKKELYFKYDQVVGTNRVDGMIIINP